MLLKTALKKQGVKLNPECQTCKLEYCHCKKPDQGYIVSSCSYGPCHNYLCNNCGNRI